MTKRKELFKELKKMLKQYKKKFPQYGVTHDR